MVAYFVLSLEETNLHIHMHAKNCMGYSYSSVRKDVAYNLVLSLLPTFPIAATFLERDDILNNT